MLQGMSQTELAGTIGLTFQQIQKYEGGKNRISAGHLYQFACALECSPMEFYEGLEDHGNGANEPPTDLAIRIYKALAGMDDASSRAVLAFVRALSDGGSKSGARSTKSKSS
jgi:transcriptional regulator with XRE-family HTH domain